VVNPLTKRETTRAFLPLRGSQGDLKDRLTAVKALDLDRSITRNLFEKNRHAYAQALQVEEIYQPKKGFFKPKGLGYRNKFVPISNPLKELNIAFPGNVECLYTNDTRSRAYCPWVKNKFWQMAPSGAERKAKIASNLTALLAVCPRDVIPHKDVYRFRLILWTRSIAHVSGLSRRIASKIGKQLQSRFAGRDLLTLIRGSHPEKLRLSQRLRSNASDDLDFYQEW